MLSCSAHVSHRFLSQVLSLLLASIHPQYWPWTLSLSSAIHPLLGITAEVFTYLNWHHQSLFPCCLQLLSACLADPPAPMADGAQLAPWCWRGTKKNYSSSMGMGFSDWTWCCPNYLSCSECFIFRNKYGMSVTVCLPPISETHHSAIRDCEGWPLTNLQQNLYYLA